MKTIYDEVSPFAANGLAKVRQDESKTERFGFIDQSGKVVVHIIYESVCLFDSTGFAKVKKNNKWGFVNLLGEEIIAPIYDSTGFFRDGLVKVCQHSKWGFDDAWSFKNGKAQVKLGNEFVYIGL